MDFEEFKSFWMRIGSPHKQRARNSRKLRRPVTGSKGIGRLAVQFLARKIEILTISDRDEDSELYAFVDWDEAVDAGDLTKAVAQYETRQRSGSFPSGHPHGTRLVLSDLNNDWSAADLEGLAQEVWWLQPPFRPNPNLKSDRQRQFSIELVSEDKADISTFKQQMRAYLDIWHARLVGKLAHGGKGSQSRVNLSLEFAGGDRLKESYTVPARHLHNLVFEIRFYHLKYRQPRGIRVSEAREYLNNYGGIHVYDSGFHLPYYGPDHDWLGIEKDHSHRLSKSNLLPEELQVSEGMNYLPTQTRMLGIVHVGTADEREFADSRGMNNPNDYLSIQVSRDRLVDNEAYKTLVYLVRWAIDYYAMRESQRSLTEIESQSEIAPMSVKFTRVERVLDHYRSAIPEEVFDEIHDAIDVAVSASETEAELFAKRAGLLGSLATAGITAVAIEHEANRQYESLEQVAARLRMLRTQSEPIQQEVNAIANEIEDWLNRVRSIRGLFSHFLDSENREIERRFAAKQVLETVITQVEPVSRGTAFRIGHISGDLRLPAARFVEWASVFQNVLINAINAMLDVDEKVVLVESASRAKLRVLKFSDTGAGVDLADSESLFAPFVRRLELSQERRSLGLGGSGLGLTIVRMIADRLGCAVSFVEPTSEYNTSLEISWKER
jgi:signal transduction histidine kinase